MSIAAKDADECLRHFTDRCLEPEGVANRIEKVGVSCCRPTNHSEGGINRILISCGTELPHPFDLISLDPRVDAQHVVWCRFRHFEPIHPDDHGGVGFDRSCVFIRCILDLALLEPGFDREDGTAEVIDPIDEIEGFRLKTVGERLNEI